LAAGLVTGALFVTPAAAHIGTTVEHLWTDHIKPLSTELFFTKSQAQALFAPDDVGTYCAKVAAHPRSYPSGPCTKAPRIAVAEGYGIIPSLSLTVGADGLPIASYWSGNPDRELRTAQCDNPRCTGVITVSEVEANPGNPDTGGVGLETSIAIGVDGLPVIAHWDQEHGDLIVSHCGNPACSFGNGSTTADEGGAADVGSFPSIAIGSDNLPVIVLFDDTDDVLQVIHCNDVACSGQDEGLTTVDTGVAGPSSLAIGTDGLPIISYSKGGLLKTAHCGNVACTSGVVRRTLDNSGGAGRSSITIGADDKPVISYVLGNYPTYQVKVAHCGNVSCTSGNNVNPIGVGGTDTAIAIGFNGNPYISYFLETSQSVADTYLKVVHCGNSTCTAGNNTKTLGPIYGGAHTDLVVGVDGRPLAAAWQGYTSLIFFRPNV
jgi:hypothetical protein